MNEEMETLRKFADAVQWAASRAAARYRFGRDKVFLAALTPDRHTRRLLVEAHRAGLLTLSRCDLAPAVDDKSLLSESETTYMNATFHFVTVAA